MFQLERKPIPDAVMRKIEKNQGLQIRETRDIGKEEGRRNTRIGHVELSDIGESRKVGEHLWGCVISSFQESAERHAPYVWQSSHQEVGCIDLPRYIVRLPIVDVVLKHEYLNVICDNRSGIDEVEEAIPDE